MSKKTIEEIIEKNTVVSQEHKNAVLQMAQKEMLKKTKEAPRFLWLFKSSLVPALGLVALLTFFTYQQSSQYLFNQKLNQAAFLLEDIEPEMLENEDFFAESEFIEHLEEIEEWESI